MMRGVKWGEHMSRRLLLLLALGGMPLWSQATNDEASASRPTTVVDRPPAGIRRVPAVTSGEGLAARYPGDRGVRSDPRVIFSEDFESDDPFRVWTERKPTENVRVIETDCNG